MVATTKTPNRKHCSASPYAVFVTFEQLLDHGNCGHALCEIPHSGGEFRTLFSSKT